MPRPGLGSKSISRDLAVSLTLLLLLFAAVLSGVGYFKQSRTMLADVQGKADEAVERIAGILAVPMWNVDYTSVGLVTSVFGQNELVDYIRVLDPDGGEVYKLLKDNPFAAGIVRRHDIVYRDRIIGSVEMGFSLRPYQARLDRLLFVSLWTTLGAVVVVLTATGLLMRVFIRKPLSDLRRGIGRVAKGDYSYTFPEVQHAELREIALRVREMSRDISARENELQGVNRALTAAEEQYRSIYENSLAGIFQFSAVGRVQRCNPAMAAIFGYADEDELRAAVDDVAEGLFVDPADWETLLQDLRERGGVSLFEARFQRRDGSGLWGTISARAILEEQGALAGVEGMFVDVSERKQAQDELAELNRHLESLVRERTSDLAAKAEELERANERLRALDRMKSAFLSSVSHELRTPLTSILGFAKLLNRDFRRHFFDKAGEDASLVIKGRRMMENLEIIEREGDRLTRLINDVLDLNKIESGRVEWNDTPIDLGEMVGRAVSAVQGLFAEKPMIELRLDLAKDLPHIYADQDRIEQVLINLLNNAAKFTDEGTVTVSGRRTAGGLAEIRVEDTGVGIPPADLAKIFEKFHQLRPADTLQDKPKGTGLGLTICREIVEHYGGSIWAESEPGAGAAIVFQLPGVGEDETEAGGAREGATCCAPGPGERGPLILVVDDDPAVNSYLSQIFEGEGFRVARSFDGESALECARSLAPDLITMDIMMPIMDGKTAISRLRSDPALAAIPVLVVSVVKGEAFGADAALEKPIDVERLLGTVHGLLNRRECRQPLMLLNEGGEPLAAPITLCAGDIVNCTADELWQRVRDGFRGTVILPYGAEKRIDVSALASRDGVSVLILANGGSVGDALAAHPYQGADPTEA
ncbi:MAG: response regulator [Desulfovibrionaceae bacterium]|nr:response regulator [Desulfovibrionaceae bacterium]